MGVQRSGGGVHSRPGQPVTGGYVGPVTADDTVPVVLAPGEHHLPPALAHLFVVDCAACNGRGLRGEAICQGCNGAGKQRV